MLVKIKNYRESKIMVKKRVFILGAGFSKQAGMPLATELTTELLKDVELKSLKDMQLWGDELRKRIVSAGLASDVGSVNVEQFFEFVEYDRELHMMKQQLCPFSRHSGDTSWLTAEKIGTWIGYMNERLGPLLWEKQKKAQTAYIRAFGEQLCESDTVVTFNYDTLVETGLSVQKRQWDHGLEDKRDGGVSVLKMHGSVDWAVLERRPGKKLEKYTRLFSKEDVNAEGNGCLSGEEQNEAERHYELWRAKDEKAVEGVIKSRSGLSCVINYPGAAGLGRCKPLHKLIGSGPTWVRAFQVLSEADEVYVIGFSMSPYDTMTRLHITSAIRKRNDPLERVVVIDPNASKLADTFTQVFRKKIEPENKEAENMDWNGLLGQMP